MHNDKIAILLDSGTDVPVELLAQDHIYVLPLRILFSDGEFIDKQTIDGNGVFERLSTEIPKTSLPSGADILEQLDQIKKEGYTAVIGVTISSGLSGTYNFVRNLMEDYDGLKTTVIDTKNIGLASGFSAIKADELIKEGLSFEEIVAKVNAAVPFSKVFFTVGSLEFLRKGGRIGLVAGTIGEMFNLKPIISCNEEGVYYTVDKVRGKKKSYERLIQLAIEYAKKGKGKIRVGITYGYFLDDFEKFKADFLEKIGEFDDYFDIQVSPALGVHTGPDAMGFAIHYEQ